MNINSVANNDKCGRCGATHGGNDHLCSVHGAVSSGCCEKSCNKNDYVAIATIYKESSLIKSGFFTVLRSDVCLDDYTLDKPYKHQDDGMGEYEKPNEFGLGGYVERYVKQE